MTDRPLLMLGYGWFPHRLGGLNRYYRDLLEGMPEARGVVIGRDNSMPARVIGASDHHKLLPLRLFAFWLAAQRSADAVEVVDSHFALYSLLPLYLGKLRSKPLVVHFQGPWTDESISAGDHSVARSVARRLLERAVYRRADQAVVLTSAFRQVLVERYRVQPWIVNVEPPGVDLDRFTLGSYEDARDQLNLPRDAFVAVSVRRLVPRMGLELLIDVWRQSLADLPAGSVLLIAGDGLLENELRRLAELDDSGSVHLLGRVSDEQLVALYQAADVAILPTLEHEGFGLVVLEAAACGTPSIVTSVGGLPEAVAALDPSLIVAPRDSVALRDRLLHTVVERPSRATTRAYAERHSWERVVEQHRSIAQRARVLNRARPEPSVGDRPLRVVYLDHVARLSGGEIALLRLLPHLDGVDRHVILAEDGPLVEKLHLAGISTEVLPFAASARDFRKGDVRGRAVPASVASATAAYVLRLAVRLRQLRPDLVHTNSLKSGVYGSLAARLAGVPVIWHVRDRIDDDYLPRAAVVMMRRMIRQLPAAVVANSQTTMATLGTSGHPAKLRRVLPDVLGDVPSHERLRDDLGDSPLTYGVVGRLAPWKGQDLFLRAFARAFQASDERAVLVGGALFGEDEYAGQLPGLAQQLGIADRVELRGHRTDIWAELARLDVLVHTSVTPEPFGQVILEGIAAGVPIIAAGAGGPAEILRHGETGVIYKPRDVQELADAMVRLRDPMFREQLSTRALTSLGAFEPSLVATQMQELYRAVTERDADCR